MNTDEQNDAIWAQVEAEWPRPLGGFECEDDEDARRAFQERRFVELVQNALAAKHTKEHMNKLTKWEQLVELFQNEPEIHLDVEVDPGTHSQAYRLHNGKDGEEWQEFCAGTLDTTLEDHKGDVIYADEVAAGLLSISGGFRGDLAGITDYKNLAAGIKA